MWVRILASIGAVSVWTFIFTTLDGDIPTLAALTRQLQTESSLADTVVQTLMREHMQLPSVLTLMLLAVLWAPVLDRALPQKND